MTRIQQLKRKYGHHKIAVDYLKARDLARDEMVVQGGWNALSDVDKYEIILLFLDDPAFDRATNDANKVGFLMSKGLTLQQAQMYLVQAYSSHNVLEIEACAKRANSEAIRNILISFLSINDAADFTRVTKDLIALYSTKGIKGINDGTSGEGIFDFIESTSGTTYETAGLAEQGYVLNGGAPYSILITGLMDILRNGNYKK